MTAKKSRKVGILGKQSRGQSSDSVVLKPRKPNNRKRKTTTERSADTAALEGPGQLHSVLHRQSANIVARLLYAARTGRRGGSIKGLCLADAVQHKAATYAVVCETLKHRAVLKSLLEESGFSAANPQMSRSAALVLLYDLLLGQGVRPHGSIERKFLAHEPQFRQAVTDLLADSDATSLAEYVKGTDTSGQRQGARRHVRVNLLRTTVAEVIEQFASPPWDWRRKHKTPILALRDEHLRDVISLPRELDLHDHQLVERGFLVLQSKASCMPAHALQAQPGWHVVDCCAAPGNKTSHVAAFVGPSGMVTAYDYDRARCKTMRMLLKRTRIEHVVIKNKNFRKAEVDADEFANVRGAIVDPSCSGSGMRPEVNLSSSDDDHDDEDIDYDPPSRNARKKRLKPEHAPSTARKIAASGKESGDIYEDFPGPTSNSDDRVTELANFQVGIVEHALRLPALQRLVYSTCSVYREENEDVVARVLPIAEQAGFKLKQALPQWPRRGLQGTYDWAPLVARVHPDLDDTDGFFIALFERA